jgi:Starch/carbohydrate-binding module (family 53)
LPLQDIIMTRAAEAPQDAPDAPAEWWEASLEVPPTAVVANFVLQYWEHFDNNSGADHRILIDFDPTQFSCAHPKP